MEQRREEKDNGGERPVASEGEAACPPIEDLG
jgi:hypothetical protein